MAEKKSVPRDQDGRRMFVSRLMSPLVKDG